MNCPSCGRPLATGTKKCVYCAHGTKFQPRPQLAIPKGTVPEHRKPIHLGRWFLLLLVIAGVAFWFTPPLRAMIQPLIDRVRSMF